MEVNSAVITVGNLAEHELQLHWMSGEENLGGDLGGMFVYHLEVASKERDIAPKDVLGEKLSVKILLADYDERYFNGHVTTWSYRGTRDERAIYHVTLRPWLWMLNLISDCRVFNKKSALDIVKSIFSKYAVAD
ncbi:MAG: contractile injection system protein, VgrG/Pvc8 family, partial [Polyangia bacterium]